MNYNILTSATFIMEKKKRVNWAVTEVEVESQISFLCLQLLLGGSEATWGLIVNV